MCPKSRLIILFAALLVVPIFVTAQAQSSSTQINFDFRNGSLGWQAGFSDYPPAADTGIYELRAEMRPLPSELGVNGTGFYLQGANRSDDLFMFMKRRLSSADGIVANQKYQLTFTLVFASNAQSGCGGIGGAPGESVFLKAGASSVEPLPILNTTTGYLRMNVDKGDQGQGGSAASVTGNIANGQPCGSSSSYVSIQRTYQHTVDVTANSNGELWLLVGTDSGYEGLTTLYYQRIEVSLVPVSASPPAPILLTEENTERAIALESVTFLRDPFPIIGTHNFSSDQHTRIMLFSRNLELLHNEDASVVNVEAEDSQGRVYILPVEYVGKVPDLDWLSQIVVKLPDEINNTGDVRVSIKLRGVVSNKAIISIKSSSRNSP